MASLNSSERRLQKAIIHMMQSAFIEIRAAESLIAAKKYADIFHNIPIAIFSSESAERDVEIYEKIYEQSRRYQLEGYIDSLKESALKEFK